MRRKLLVGVALVLAMGTGIGVAVAAPAFVDSKDRPPPPVEGAHTEAALPADNEAARLVVQIDGSANGFTVKRQEGVHTPNGVTNPRPGRYCIRPSASISPRIVVNKAVVTVGTDYYGTLGFDAFAQWNSSRQGCPVGTIAVNTFDAGAGTPLNDVAFTVVVT
jgi:hypothetical protein